MKLLIASEISPRRIGSYERYHFGVAQAMKQRHWETVSLFSGDISEAVRARFLPEGGRVVTGLGNAGASGSRKSWLDAVRAERPDVVWLHFFPIYGSFVYRLRRLLPGALICQTDHISRGNARRGPAKSTLHQIRARLFDGCIDKHFAVSQFIADRLIASDRVPARKVTKILNGIDLQAFRPGPHRGPYISAICYMRREKGIRILLEALALLRKAGLEPPCRLIGDGPSLDEHRNHARDLNLSHVEFLGNRDDVDDLLRESMLTVVPSVWPEAFSFAAAESMACGVPVVASAVGGLPEVVADGETGRLVPPGDPAALADAIASLIQDQACSKRMALAARERVERMFGLDDKIEQTVLLLDPTSSALHGKPGHLARSGS